MNKLPVQGADAELQAGTIALSKQAYAVAILFSTFQIITAAYSPLCEYGGARRSRRVPAADDVRPAAPLGRKWLGWAVGAVAFAIGLYHWVFEAELIQRAGELTDMGHGYRNRRPSFSSSRRRGARWDSRCR